MLLVQGPLLPPRQAPPPRALRQPRQLHPRLCRPAAALVGCLSATRRLSPLSWRPWLPRTPWCSSFRLVWGPRKPSWRATPSVLLPWRTACRQCLSHLWLALLLPSLEGNFQALCTGRRKGMKREPPPQPQLIQRTLSWSLSRRRELVGARGHRPNPCSPHPCCRTPPYRLPCRARPGMRGCRPRRPLTLNATVPHRPATPPPSPVRRRGRRSWQTRLSLPQGNRPKARRPP
mmetsp:Transcript_12611/g.35444  ORF Transcript_12611/g.35444 Transcript_12611/m.35444 type:complete len:232 (-) Transcript_12611:843-1538(-)